MFFSRIGPWESKIFLVTLVLIIYLLLSKTKGAGDENLGNWGFPHLLSPSLISLHSPTLESWSIMQTPAVGKADKRLMEKPLSKASNFPSHIAIALWPSTYPGNLEDTCWSVPVLLEGCVPYTVFSSLAVSFQGWLCFLLCPVHYSQTLVYSGKVSVKGLGINLLFLPQLALPTFRKSDHGIAWLWWLFYRCSVPLCWLFRGHLQLVLFAGKEKDSPESVELCLTGLRSERLSLCRYYSIIRNTEGRVPRPPSRIS